MPADAFLACAFKWGFSASIGSDNIEDKALLMKLVDEENQAA